MKKQTAIELLGGTISLASKAIGVSYQAVNKWPDELTARVEDRVWAALARISDKQKSKPRLNKVNLQCHPALASGSALSNEQKSENPVLR